VELAEAANLALKAGEQDQAMQLFFRVKFVATDNLDVRRKIIDLFIEQEETERAGFELLDLAEVQFGQGNDAEAEEALTRAADISDSLSVKQQVADTLQSHGRTEAATELLEQLLALAQESGDHKAIAAACKTLGNIRPGDLQLRYLRCLSLWECDPDSADEETPGTARELLENQQAEQAVTLLRKAADVAQEFSDGTVESARVAVHAGDVESAGKLYSLVIAGLAEQDARTALDLSRSVAMLIPDHPTALSDCGVLLANFGMAEEAATIYSRLAQRAEHEGKLEEALQFSEDALSQREGHVGALQTRARVVDALHGAEEALPYYQSYLEGARAAAEADALLQALEAFVTRYPDALEVRIEYAEALAAGGQIEEATAQFLQAAQQAAEFQEHELQSSALKRAAEIAPGNADIQSQYAGALAAAGEHEEAGRTYCHAAGLYQSAGDPEQARENAQRACEIAPASVECQELLCSILRGAKDQAALADQLPNLVTALRSSGRVRKALDYARELMTLSPGALQVRRTIAELHSEDGETDEALREYAELAQEFEAREDYTSALQMHAEMAQLTAPDVKTLYRLVGLADKAGPEAAADARLQLGQALLSSGQVLEAFNVARDLGNQKTGVLSAARLLQKIGAAAGVHDEALSAYLSAAEAYRSLPDQQEPMVDCLEGALALDPGNTTAHTRLAEYYESSGQNDFAFSHRVALLPIKEVKASAWKNDVTRLRKQAGQDAGKYVELGRRILQSERVAEALEDFETAARLAAEERDFPLVIEAADSAEALVFNSTSLCMAKFQALLNSGEKEQAVDWLRECAHAALRSGQAADAEQYATRWVELERSDPDALELLASAYYKQNRTQKAVETYISLANVLKFAGEYDRAIAILRQALAVEPESVPARQLLWQVLLEAERQSEALSEMQQLADLLIERNSYREASTLLSRILDYRTNSEETLERLASLVHEHEGFTKAAPYFRKLLQLRSATMSADELANEYERILKLEGADAELRADYAEFLSKQGLLPEAKQQYVQVAQVYRDELNDPKRAIEYLNTAVELLPGNEDGRVYEELASLHQALGDEPNAVNALRDAALTYCRAGEGKAAVKAARSALDFTLPEDRAPDNALLALALHTAGEKKKARTAFDQVFAAANARGSELSTDTRRRVFEILLLAEPGNTQCAAGLIRNLPATEIAERALPLAADRETADDLPGAIAILTAAHEAAPNDASILSALVASCRRSGDTAQLQKELLALAETQIAQHETGAANATVGELATLPPGPELLLQLGSLYDRLQNPAQSAASYASAAELLLETGDEPGAVLALRSALQADASAVPAATVATLARKGGDELRHIAQEILEAALIARTRTRSLVVASALLERASEDDARRILSMVYMRAGAGFLTAITGTHADWLLERNDNARAAMVTTFMLELSPNSPDAWWLASQLKKRYGDKQGSAEAALHAAQLYNEAGAVSEEESCYKEVLDEIPEDEPTLQTLAYFYEREKRGEEGVEVMRRLADIAVKRNDAAAATNWLRKALDLAPGNNALREQYATGLLNQGKNDAALEQLLDAGRRSSKAGEFDRAQRCYSQALQLSPDNEQAASFLLDAATQSGNEQEARRLMLLLAEIKAESGAVVHACQLLRNVLNADPDNLEALEKLSAFSLLAHDFDSHRTAAIKLGNILVKQSQYVAAIQQFESVLEHAPENIEVLQTLIDCCAAEGLQEKGVGFATRLLDLAREAGDPARVRQAATTILDYNEHHADARRELAEALLCLNRIPDAVNEWSRAAEEFHAAKDLQAALDCYRRIVQVSPTNLAAWRKLGDLSLLTGDSDAARGAYVHLLEAYTSSGDTEKADALITRMLQLDPDDAELHREALEAYRRAGRHEHAMQQVLWLVRAAMKQGNHEEAEQLIQVGMQISPNSMALQQCELEVLRSQDRTDELQMKLRQLADNYLQAGDRSAAAEVLEQLRDADPSHIETHMELCEIYLQLEDMPRAIGAASAVVRELLDRQETQEARSFAEELLGRHPGNLELRARIAEAFAQNGMADVGAHHYAACAEIAGSHQDTAAQVHFLQLAVQARPRWIDGYQKLVAAATAAGENDTAVQALGQLADLLLDNRKFSDAASAVRQQIELDPKAREPRLKLVEVYEKAGDRPKLAAAIDDLTSHYLSSGLLDEAVEAAKQATIVSPNDPQTIQRYIELFAQVGNEAEILDDYVKLAQAHASGGNIAEAMQVFEQAAAIDRRNTDVREKFAAFLLANGQKSRALTEMRKIAEVYKTKGEADAAVDILLAALALAPQDAETCLALAAAQQFAGHEEEAQATYTRASNILNGTSVMKAIDVYRRLISTDDVNPELRRRLIELLVKAGENSSAAVEAEKLAEVCADLQKLDDAEEAMLQAEDLQPHTPADLRKLLESPTDNTELQYLRYVRLGHRLFVEGDIDNALNAFRSARSLNDERPQLIQRCIDCISLIAPEAEAIPDYIALAEKHMKRGETTEARQVYEQVARLDPFNADARSGLAAAIQAEHAPKATSQADTQQDRQVLGRRERRKRVALEELLSACKEATLRPENA
jgi:tetratricopeptide (TPR) repeat protein